MDYTSVRETADCWGITQQQLIVLCAEKRIANAKLIDNIWFIPTGTPKPADIPNFPHSKIEKKQVRPFLKWAGGKGQLLHEIERYYPFADKEITKYAEPFVGGGAVLFDILSKFQIEQVYISDINHALINAYSVIRNNVDAVIEALAALQNEFVPLDTEKRKAYYMSKRAQFNCIINDRSPSVSIEQAVLMIFLNRTCFNGLFRVNRKGAFNVPMGAYKAPLICDEANLRAASKVLQNVSIACDDYHASANFIDKHTFVYFDPPYRPLTDTSKFTAYTANSFDDNEQRMLAKFVDEMSERGAKIVVSNSDPKNIDINDDFFDSIYANYKIRRIEASRMINCNSSARGKVNELLISNF